MTIQSILKSKNCQLSCRTSFYPRIKMVELKFNDSFVLRIWGLLGKLFWGVGMPQIGCQDAEPRLCFWLHGNGLQRWHSSSCLGLLRLSSIQQLHTGPAFACCWNEATHLKTRGISLWELERRSGMKMQRRHTLSLTQSATGSKRKWDTLSCDMQPFNAALCRALSALATFSVCALMNFYLFKHSEDRKICSELFLLYIALISLWEVVCRSLL